MPTEPDEPRYTEVCRRITQYLVQHFPKDGANMLKRAEITFSWMYPLPHLSFEGVRSVRGVRYSPDLMVTDKRTSEPIVFFEVVWIDVARFDYLTPVLFADQFKALSSYALLDFREPRIMLFERRNGWSPKIISATDAPKMIEGMEFAIEWQQILIP